MGQNGRNSGQNGDLPPNYPISSDFFSISPSQSPHALQPHQLLPSHLQKQSLRKAGIEAEWNTEPSNILTARQRHLGLDMKNYYEKRQNGDFSVQNGPNQLKYQDSKLGRYLPAPDNGVGDGAMALQPYFDPSSPLSSPHRYRYGGDSPAIPEWMTEMRAGVKALGKINEPYFQEELLANARYGPHGHFAIFDPLNPPSPGDYAAFMAGRTDSFGGNPIGANGGDILGANGQFLYQNFAQFWRTLWPFHLPQNWFFRRYP